MRQAISFFCLAIVLIGVVRVVEGKGAPDLIVITGKTLSTPVEITETATLRKFDPWSGQFIDWTKGTTAPASDSSASFEVSFFQKWPERHSTYDRGDLKMIYSVEYRFDAKKGVGFIFLPNEGDLGRINKGTILREAEDGKWHQASVDWDRIIMKLGHDSHQQFASIDWHFANYLIALSGY